MQKEVSYRTALRQMLRAGGKIISASFIKEDGSIREITFRRNVASQVKGNPNNEKNDSRKRVKRGSIITVVEMDGGVDRKWKSINLQTMFALHVNGESFKIGSRAA